MGGSTIIQCALVDWLSQSDTETLVEERLYSKCHRRGSLAFLCAAGAFHYSPSECALTDRSYTSMGCDQGSLGLGFHESKLSSVDMRSYTRPPGVESRG